jgi:hypothetical protein
MCSSRRTRIVTSMRGAGASTTSLSVMSIGSTGAQFAVLPMKEHLWSRRLGYLTLYYAESLPGRWLDYHPSAASGSPPWGSASPGVSAAARITWSYPTDAALVLRPLDLHDRLVERPEAQCTPASRGNGRRLAPVLWPDEPISASGGSALHVSGLNFRWHVGTV